MIKWLIIHYVPTIISVLSKWLKKYGYITTAALPATNRFAIIIGHVIYRYKNDITLLVTLNKSLIIKKGKHRKRYE